MKSEIQNPKSQIPFSLPPFVGEGRGGGRAPRPTFNCQEIRLKVFYERLPPYQHGKSIDAHHPLPDPPPSRGRGCLVENRNQVAVSSFMTINQRGLYAESVSLSQPRVRRLSGEPWVHAVPRRRTLQGFHRVARRDRV